MNWYLEVWKKYAVFDGRARRREYWTFFLVHFIIGCILRFVESFADIAFESSLYWSYWGAVFLPGMAVSVRRLHDTGRSGWWNLIALVPIFGAIVLLAFAVQDSLWREPVRPQSQGDKHGVARRASKAHRNFSSRHQRLTLPRFRRHIGYVFC